MPGTPIGLDMMYYAILTKDDSTGVAYGVPKRMAGAITANIDPGTARGTLFADNGPAEVTSTLGEITLEISVTDIGVTAQADLLGHTVDGNGIVISKGSDTPPWVAVGFRALKSNGEFRYVWLTKGKFSEPQSNHETRGDSVNFQAPTMTGSFVKREFDDQWRRVVDTDNPSYSAAIGTNWFTGVEGAADTTAPTITSVVPAANAVAVVVTSPVTWTFSEAMAVGTLTLEHFAVVADATGANVAGTLSVNAGKTVVTFTPTANFTAATAYRAIVTSGVKDVAGKALAATSVTKFTTA